MFLRIQIFVVFLKSQSDIICHHSQTKSSDQAVVPKNIPNSPKNLNKASSTRIGRNITQFGLVSPGIRTEAVSDKKKRTFTSNGAKMLDVSNSLRAFQKFKNVWCNLSNNLAFQRFKRIRFKSRFYIDATFDF